jgi:tRNA-specific 2-thiouridylase
MSGGVDSSLAAALLVRAGHEVIGVFLRLGPGGEARAAASERSCCSVSDARDAARVADRLGIPFYPLDYEREFGRVIDYFVEEYHRGRTPNPCARCNQWVKFGTLLEQAEALGCEWIATGHYAQIAEPAAAGARPARSGATFRRRGLRRGADPAKDQSYFLFTVSSAALDRAVFPVGHLTKDECRRRARDLGLPVADKPDSQEICFVPGNDYRAVLEARSPERIRPGAFIDAGGRALGGHPGHQHFTVGQRRGLGRGFGEPMYVIAIDAAANTVTLGPREGLAAAGCEVAGANWLSIEAPEPGITIEAEVQVRYRSRAAPARLRILEGDRVEVEFARPQDAVTPGQAAVFYDGELLLGGGWIEASKSAR